MPSVHPRKVSWYGDRLPVEEPAQAPVVVRTFTFALSCPVDGAELVLEAEGRPTPTSAPAIVRCSSCRRPFLVRAVIEATDGRATARP